MDTLAVYNVDEGEGTTLVDSSGNGYDATLDTGDSVSWWNDAAPMVSQAVGDMDLAHGFFTDKAYHALPMHQSAMDELGVELVTNGGFDTDLGWSKGVGWTIASGRAEATAVAAYQSLSQELSGLTAGTYVVKFDAIVTTGNIYCYLGGATVKSNFTSGSYEIEVTTSVVNYSLVFEPVSTFTGSIDNISIREVNPVINVNDQYFRKTCTGSNPEYFFYKQVLTGEDLLTVETACCLI